MAGGRRSPLRETGGVEPRLTGRAASPERTSLRLDLWLWFARFVKTRSRASRLCTTGAVTVNGRAVKRAHREIRIGDNIVIPHGVLVRTIRVKALGERRGPPREALLMYEETAAPVPMCKFAPTWTPLLVDDATASPQPRE